MWNRFGKYNAQKVRADGYLFDSKAEHKRWCELKILLQAGKITNLEVHPKIPLDIAGVAVCTYMPDFRYEDSLSGKTLWEDVKGHPTPEFKLKVKLLAILRPDVDLKIIQA